MMGRPEGSLGNERTVVGKLSGNGIDVGGLQHFLTGHCREDGRDAVGKHTLAGTGRTDEQDIMSPGSSKLHAGAGFLLSPDVGEVENAVEHFVRCG